MTIQKCKMCGLQASDNSYGTCGSIMTLSKASDDCRVFILSNNLLTTHNGLCIVLHKERMALMATNLSINMELLNDALIVGGLKSKKDTVNLALEEFIQKRRAADILTLFGTVEYDADYNYKKARRRD